jgi:hypothetical protein
MVPLTVLLAVASRWVLVNDDTTQTPLFTSLGCTQPEPLWLEAQSVPSASMVPCVQSMPTGWRLDTANARNGWSRFTLTDNLDGSRVVVRLSATCDITGATQRPSDQPGTQRYERIEPRDSGPVTTWHTAFHGGCVTAQLHPNSDANPTFANEAASALGFTTRDALQQELEARSHGRLHLDSVTGG